jgi:sec-independent protein translocase protein tatA/E homolog
MIQPLMIGTTELIVIGGAVLLFFGGKKIPELMRSLGQGVKNFKKGMHDESVVPEEVDMDSEQPDIKDEKATDRHEK